MSSAVSNSNKKAYREPKLAKYGNLTEMTMANTMAGNKDGGANNTKTG